MANSERPQQLWEKLYEQAAVETHKERLTDLVNQVEEAMMKRTAEIAHSPDHSEERNAMVQATENLLIIKTEKLSFPPIQMK